MSSKFGNFSEFPCGTRVKVIASCVDFYFFDGEIGTVIRNSGAYLGIIVVFDEPRRFKDGHIQTEFNFNPIHLERIETGTQEIELVMRDTLEVAAEYYTKIIQLEQELARVQAKSEERKTVIEKVECIGDETALYCPWCHASSNDGFAQINHDPDCPRQKALED